MRRSFAAVAVAGSLLVSALTSTSAFAVSSITGGGSSFQANFEYACRQSFNATHALTVNYDGTLGSGTGMGGFHSGTKDFAGTDGPDVNNSAYNPQDGGNQVVIPITAAPVAIAYKLNGKNGRQVTGLRLDASVLSGIYRGDITYWDNSAIKNINSSIKGNLPHTAILPEYRANGSGTTKNLLSYLSATNPSANWVASKNFNTPEANTVKVATAGSSQANSDEMINTLQTTNGAIGYADLPDTVGQAGFQIASLKNAAGAYIKPTVSAGSKLVNGATESKFKVGSTTTGYIAGADATALWTKSINGAYQLTVVTYILASSKTSDTNTAVKQYVRYALNHCQGKAGFSSLSGTPAMTIALAQSQLISSTN